MTGFDKLSAVVVGAGSIGRRHMKNLRELGLTTITAVDLDPERLKSAIDEISVTGVEDISVALESNPNVVLICTPPSLHVDGAITAIKAGAHVFIEKPLSNDLAQIDRLASVADEHNKLVQVGYNLRHIPALKSLRALIALRQLGRPLWARFEFGQYLPDWRPWQDYRQSYTARRELGGGIILDASHEIDLAMWLLGKPMGLYCLASKTSALEMNVEDTATLLFTFQSGCQAEVHVDCVQREYTRCLKIAFENGTAEWSWPENVLRIYDAAKGEKILPSGNYMANQMYIDELAEFLFAAANNAQTTSLEEGREVVRIALEAHRSAGQNCWVDLR